MNDPRDPTPRPQGQVTSPKVLLTLSLALVAIALGGLVVGYGQPEVGWNPPPSQRPTLPATVFPTVPYLEMDGKRRSPNHDWHSHLDHLVSTAELDDQALPIDPEWRQAVEQRAADRRTYPGARAKKPTPLSPHPLDPPDTESCLQCHGEQGRVIGRLVAPPMRHKVLNNCGKCHKTADQLAAEEKGD